jgi:hypothetical protein
VRDGGGGGSCRRARGKRPLAGETLTRAGKKNEGDKAKLTEGSRGEEKAGNALTTKGSGAVDGELDEEGGSGVDSHVQKVGEHGRVLINREKGLERGERRRRAPSTSNGGTHRRRTTKERRGEKEGRGGGFIGRRGPVSRGKLPRKHRAGH